jgi:hypothetical protein
LAKPGSKPVAPIRPGAPGAKIVPPVPVKPAASSPATRSKGSPVELKEDDAIVDFLQEPSPSTNTPAKPKIKTPPIPAKGTPATNRGKTPEASVAGEVDDDSEFWKILDQ